MKRVILIFSALIIATTISAKELKSQAIGVDMAHYQGDLIKTLDTSHSKLAFVICEATEGTGNIDESFRDNWKAIQKKKRIRGAYHVYHNDKDPIAQANFFINTVSKQDYEKNDLPLIVKIQHRSIKRSMSSNLFQENFLAFLSHIENKTKRKPIIYTNPIFSNQYLLSETFGNYPLWLADYTPNSQPTLPFAWKKKGYMFWQKTPSLTPYSQASEFDVFSSAELK